MRWRRHGDPLYVPVHVTRRCTVKGCNGKHNAKGYCGKHYNKLKKYGDPQYVPDPKETKKKQSESQKEWLAENENPMTGRTQSDKTKNLISKALKGKSSPIKGKKFPGKTNSGSFKPGDGKGKKKSKEWKKKVWTPKRREVQRKRLRTTRHNQQKPNKPELKIKKILTDAGLVFNPEQNLNKFIKSSDESNFGMFINIPFSHPELQQKHHEVDFLIPPNKIIEHDGAYDHADPRKYSADAKIRETTAEKIWKNDKMITDSLKKEGYKILVVLGLDFLEELDKTTKEILKFAIDFNA